MRLGQLMYVESRLIWFLTSITDSPAATIWSTAVTTSSQHMQGRLRQEVLYQSQRSSASCCPCYGPKEIGPELWMMRQRPEPHVATSAAPACDTAIWLCFLLYTSFATNTALESRPVQVQLYAALCWIWRLSSPPALLQWNERVTQSLRVTDKCSARTASWHQM